jgi:hypothetical protein
MRRDTKWSPGGSSTPLYQKSTSRLGRKVSARAKRFPDGLGYQVSHPVQDCFLCSSNQYSIQILIGTSSRDPGIDSVFDLCAESFLLEPDSPTLLFRLSEIVLYLCQNPCFFGLEEFFVQSSFGRANLKVKSANASVRDSIPSILSSLAIAKANMKS